MEKPTKKTDKKAKSLDAAYAKWDKFATEEDCKMLADSMRVSLGKPLTEEEFKAMCAKSGTPPTILKKHCA